MKRVLAFRDVLRTFAKKLRFPHYCLIFFLLIALLLRIDAARFPNIVHPDEIFQTQEPAHRLAYGYGVVTWEWREGIRSWVFPAFLAGVMRATTWLGRGSSGYVWGIAIVLSLISLTTVWFGFSWAKRASGVDAAIIAAGACATWYGLAVSLRIQLAPAVAFAVVYFCYPNWRKRFLPLAAGFLLPVLAFGLVDAFTWSYPFQSFFRYFWVNAIEGRSALYGTQPWFWYLLVLAVQMLPLVILSLFGVGRCPFLGWIVLIILASHSMISHKEVRFIYPVMPLVVTLAGVGIVEIANDFNESFKNPVLAPKVIVGTGLVLCGLLSYWVAPRFPYWQKDSGGVAAFGQLSKNPGICGVGLYEVPWFETGGYTYLHQNVPIVLIPGPKEFDKEASNFNAVIAEETLPILRNDFVLSDCWSGVCLYERPGACTHSSENDINTVLRRTGN